MKKTRFISLITAAIVLLGTLTANANSASVLPTNEFITEEISFDDSGFFSSPSVELYSDDNDDDPEDDPVVKKAISIINSKKFEKTILEGLNKLQTEIDLSDLEIPLYINSKFEYRDYIVSAFHDRFFDILYTHPEIIYAVSSVGVSMSYYSGSSVGYISQISTSYLDDLSSKESLNLFDKWSSRIISTLITDDMNDYDKALILHDYLAKTVEYNNNAVSTSDAVLTDVDKHARSAYGAIVDKTAVCQGYALAYAHLLSLAGVESEFVTSRSMNHAWNMVKIDDEYYHVDVTFDDPLNISNKDAGVVSHEYFFRSDDSISTPSYQNPDTGVASYHHGWSTYDSISCGSTSFDKNFQNDTDEVYSFRRTRKEMKYKDGKYYYIQNYPSAYAKSNFDGSEFELLDDSSEYIGIDTTVTISDVTSPTPSIEVQTPSPTPIAEAPTPSAEAPTPTAEAPEPTPTIEAFGDPIKLDVNVFGNSAVLSSKLTDKDLMCSGISVTYFLSSDDDILITKYSTMSSLADCTINIEGDVSQNSDGSMLISDPVAASVRFEYKFEEPILSSELPELSRLYIQGLSGNDHSISQDVKVQLSEAKISIQSENGNEDINYTGTADNTYNLSLKQYQKSDYLKMENKQSIVIDRENGDLVYYRCEFVPNTDDIDEIVNNKDSYKIYLAEYDSNGTLIGIRSNNLMTNDKNYNYYQVPETWLENGNTVKVLCLKDLSEPLSQAIVCSLTK